MKLKQMLLPSAEPQPIWVLRPSGKGPSSASAADKHSTLLAQ